MENNLIEAQNKFIERAMFIHGEKYDYTNVIYKNARTSVKLKCNLCSNYWFVVPYSHAKPNNTGSGCPYCAGFFRTTEDFIKASKLIHGSKYDYSNVIYKNAKSKVKIFCIKHQRYWLTTWHSFVINGHGCSKCGAEVNKPSVESIIAKFEKVHDKKYDYKNFLVWNGWHSKIEVLCKFHVNYSFYPTPASHFYGLSGCDLCNNIQKSLRQIKSTEEFIFDAVFIHGNLYDYTNSKYIGERKNISIFCKVHGNFNQRAGHHVRGSGCTECRNDKMAIERKLSYKEFLDNSKFIHLEKYSYPNSFENFQLRESKVSISCPSHGLFSQIASNHMHGSGCPRCRQSKGERDVRAFLLLLGFEFEEQKKFPNCVDKRELPFDFYVPSANLLIEFDGEQHFFERTTGIFKGKFNDIIKRDLIKSKFAASSNFNLLRISWNEDVSNALSTYFSVMS